MDETVKKKILSRLESCLDFRFNPDQIIETLEDSEVLSGFEVEGYLGSDRESSFFHLAASEKDYIAKIGIDFDDGSIICNKVPIFAALRGKKVSYLNNILKSGVYSGSLNAENSFDYCVVIFEKPDSDLSKKDLFFGQDIDSKARNSIQLFRLIGKVIKSFAEMNFLGKVLHGDIRPENIMVKFKDENDEFESKFDPVIINSDFMLDYNSKKRDLNLQRYLEDYRPPEMAKKVQAPAPGKELTSKQKKEILKEESKTHEYSSELTEDVYALGKTIQKVLENQATFIDEGECSAKKLNVLAASMVVEKEKPGTKGGLFSSPKPVKVRKNMMEILEDYILLYMNCNKHRDMQSDPFYNSLLATVNAKPKNLLLV